MASRPFLALLLLSLPAGAETLASGADLRAALVGKTVEGSMLASGGYAEYYAPDGQIRAADYAGAWSISGNRMCFAYEGDPPNCWAAAISGNRVIWIGADGEEGTGTITPGNPSGW